MAKSIFDILDDLESETSVKGVLIPHTLPRKNYPSSEIYEDKELLSKWTESKEITHAVLQAGIRSFLINDRARFKATKKGVEWTPEIGQRNVNNAKWTVQERPREVLDKEKVRREAEMAMMRKTITGMRASGLDDATIGQILKAQFENSWVDIAMKS